MTLDFLRIAGIEVHHLVKENNRKWILTDADADKFKGVMAQYNRLEGEWEFRDSGTGMKIVFGDGYKRSMSAFLLREENNIIKETEWFSGTYKVTYKDQINSSDTQLSLLVDKVNSGAGIELPVRLQVSKELNLEENYDFEIGDILTDDPGKWRHWLVIKKLYGMTPFWKK